MYVELHAHSAFSLLDGASLPDELQEIDKHAVEAGINLWAASSEN